MQFGAIERRATLLSFETSIVGPRSRRRHGRKHPSPNSRNVRPARLHSSGEARDQSPLTTIMLDHPSTIDHVLVVSLALVSPWIDVALYPRLARATRAGHSEARSIAYSAYLVFAWGCAALVARHWSSEGRAWETLGLGSGSAIGAAFGVAMVLAYVVLALRARRRIVSKPERLTRLRASFGRAEALVPRSRIERVLFAAVALSAGCVEEFLYRGYITWYVAIWLGPVAALALSSMLFGFAHIYLGRAHVARTAMVGLVLGIVVLTAGSLWPAVAIHAAMDLVAGDLGWRVFARVAPERSAPAA
jgi:membrane protease YdiL (CAAX protease family)